MYGLTLLMGPWQFNNESKCNLVVGTFCMIVINGEDNLLT